MQQSMIFSFPTSQRISRVLQLGFSRIGEFHRSQSCVRIHGKRVICALSAAKIPAINSYAEEMEKAASS
jgi:hypothetical protein